jgi:alkanesulfonate monooxygenase SsuD/methylene tetrahydromethanopterin reductase-like flavin-dependent oxidoreductase (luciferase family)
MRRAGRAADVWMPYLCSPARLARGLATAREEAERHGRDPSSVTGAYFAWTVTDPDAQRARSTALATLADVYGQDMERIADATIPTGTPAQVAERLAAYAEAGATEVVVAPAVGPDAQERMVERFATEVLPALRVGS